MLREALRIEKQLEGFWRPVCWGWLVAFLALGPKRGNPWSMGPRTPWGHPAWSSGMPQGASSPGAIYLGSRTWGALRSDITLTPAVINSDNDATCYTGHQHNHR